MKRAILLSLTALAACNDTVVPALSPIASFQVNVGQFYRRDEAGNRILLEVVTPCQKRYGSEAQVPVEVRGSNDCPYVIARGDLEVDVAATAIDASGNPATEWNGAPSFRVVPGNLTGDYSSRWAPAVGGVARATVKVAHLYGQVRVWAEDAPPKYIYSDGGIAGDVSELPPEPVAPNKRSYATGLSPTIFFEQPTLQKVQQPDGFDNRSSPLVGEFLTIGREVNPFTQNCAQDPARDGRPLLMVVTGTDPSGFYVTDVSACRLVEQTADATGTQVRTSEPHEGCVGGRCAISQGACMTEADCLSYLPGTYGSMFVYNYSFPEGLDQGDLLFTLSGSVQEFTSTTQLTFPAWSIAEKVRQLPLDQWNKWLDLAPPTEVTLRTCGGDNALSPFLTDGLCGHNRRNLKLESLESGLVRVRSVRFPQVFQNCDINADATVPFFCETRPAGTWIWASCGFADDGSLLPEAPNDAAERTCNQNCVVGMGEFAGKICSEESTFIGFGQYVVEMASPGLPEAGLDTSLPARSLTIDLAGTAPSGPMTAFAPGLELVVACNVEVKLAYGHDDPDPTNGVVLPKNTVTYRTMNQNESTVRMVATTPAEAGAKCSVGVNPKTRINLSTKDALPELNPDCSEADAVPERAEQCRFIHGATFDVVGHLKQVQPARPRWLVTPRDPDDVCCHPGPGLQCPTPIKPCQ